MKKQMPLPHAVHCIRRACSMAGFASALSGRPAVEEECNYVHNNGAPTVAVTAENMTSGPDFPGDVAQGGETVLVLDHFPLEALPITLTKNPGAVALVRNDAGANGYSAQVVDGEFRVTLNTALALNDTVNAAYTRSLGEDKMWAEAKEAARVVSDFYARVDAAGGG